MFFDFGGGPLNSVADVLIDAITDNEIIQYDSASGKYINRTLAEAGIASAAGFLLNTTDEFTGTFTLTGGALISDDTGVGITSLRTDIGGLTSRLQLEGANAANSAMSIISNTTSSNGPALYLGKSRSATTGGAATVNSGDRLGSFIFLGADGVGLNTPAASVAAQVDGTPGANDMPGRLILSTTADGASVVTEALRLDSSQNAIFAGNLDLPGIINNTPGSDIDATLLTVGVTGTPTFSWDESEDAFDFNKGLNVTGNLNAIGTAGVGIARTQGTFNVATASSGTTVSPSGDEGVFENNASGGVSVLIPNASTGAYIIGSPGAAAGAKMQWHYTNGLMDFLTVKAGAQMTFASGSNVEFMRGDGSQNVLIGLTSGNDGKLHIDQASLTGAKPVLHLDQADLSEEFIKFSSTIGVGNPIEAVAAKTMTPTHFLRVELEGGLVRYINAGTIA